MPLHKTYAIAKHTAVKILVASVLVSFFSCSPTQFQKKNKVSDHSLTRFELDKSDFVVLPFQEEWDWVFSNAKPTELSQAELIEIEKLINLAIKKNNENEASKLINHNKNYSNDKWKETGYELKIKRFKRQYVPVINQNGKKEIWINFFCDDWGVADWRSDLIQVLDGGNCYFSLKIDLTNKTYSELSINGYA